MRFTALLFAIFACICLANAATVEEAQKFVADVNVRYGHLVQQEELASFEFSVNITPETEARAVAASLETKVYMSEVLMNITQFDDIRHLLDNSTSRQMYLLRVLNTQPPLRDAAANERLSTVRAKMEAIYGSGQICGINITTVAPNPQGCYDLEKLSTVIAESRDYDELTLAWTAWRNVTAAIKPLYTEFVSLSNTGANDIGFADTGDLWRSAYDMPQEEFTQVVEDLWEQVQPLYEQLHCYVRSKLKKHYGSDNFPHDGYIPAQLLGNMWAQDWDNIFDIVAPYPNEPNQDATAGIINKGWTATDMVRFTEDFFVGIGLPAFTDEFWTRSMFTKPADRQVVCHASAWDLGYSDKRIKMCIQRNSHDLFVIHHECGHIEYYYEYSDQLPIYRTGANDGFHEGIGDTVALSVTPEYLFEAGLLANVSDTEESNINQLMHMALKKIAFLPFGLLVDKWRWEVFAGNVTDENYNDGWWDLVRDLQGVDAPVERTENDFDPGAKYHIPANTPYMRYFLAHILQFQFQKALCDAAGHTGPLHKCTINKSLAAGAKLSAMLKLGASKPWQDALEVLSGERTMNASALIEYFEPLMEWLEEQNGDEKCGWGPHKHPSLINTPALIILIGVGVVSVAVVGIGAIYIHVRNKRAAYNEMS